ncbi:ALG6, ALG8 glycosyltransferase [Basidiobolus meristosporus CBS 931.73]|uniref:Alpha-1,3-glucosyltransferase n=1 Tax=Basidiobolus meristosporus CBS 931.73 TaxID=1314790 RepID=A0A1Y1XTI3_9FUNG|nr:ALG6, ALG8 glycosyltransferase [Basidiobolus meristosporus CBS 931.73]|eukprot:ORX88995.1 ALG6, ALG8 glycosyltransferase [Basidiobolus meristosporus CBS 931.73]
MSGVHTSPSLRWFQFLDGQGLRSLGVFAILVFAFYLRWTVGLNPYSGYSTPPLYGDYEAQRHWMEITLHLPISQWYRYDLQYWGLDYPPLTAYVSWICGYVGQYFNPEWFLLDSSRGYESVESKLYMRATVIFFEYLIYIPAMVFFYKHWAKNTNWSTKNAALLLVLLQPALILIDNGHFQYNSIMLGLTAWAVVCFLCDLDVIGSVMFCLALSFKQMALYYALPIFAYLLGKCIKRRTEGFFLLIKLGITVVLTLGVCLAPFLTSTSDLLQVAHRVFPVARGLYEDKVANVWCAISIFVKLRSLFNLEKLVQISALTTLLCSAPSFVNLLLNPTKKRLIYSLCVVSLSFFLFSFQVHEKTILLPILPVSMLILEEPVAVPWFINVATFSMFPLLKRDGLMIPYFIMLCLWNWLGNFLERPKKYTLVLNLLSYVTMVAIHALEFLVVPPAKYPDIFTMLNVIFSCGMFTLFFVYFNYRQLTTSTKSKKKTQ